MNKGASWTDLVEGFEMRFCDLFRVIDIAQVDHSADNICERCTCISKRLLDDRQSSASLLISAALLVSNRCART